MLIENFLNYLRFEKRYSQHTLVSYQNDLTQFNDFIKQTFDTDNVSEVSHLYIRSWMVSLSEAGITARSINRKLSAIKSYYKFLIKRGVVEKNPTIKIVSPKTSKRLPAYVEGNNMQQLFNQVQFGEGFPALRDRLLLEVLYSTGMRRSELINLKVQDIDFGHRYVKVLGKGNKERLIPFDKGLESSIELYLNVKDKLYEGSEWLLVDDKGNKMPPEFVYRTVRKYLDAVTTIEKRSPHVLRHTFATHLSNNGADLNAIKELLGHSSLAATQVYTHNNIEKLKDIFKQSHPKA